MAPKSITSLQNPRVKEAVRLRSARQRGKRRRIVIDGAREIQRALEGGVEVVELFACPALCASDEARELVARAETLGGEVWHVSPEVFEKLAFGARAEGVLAVAETPRRALAELAVEPGGLVAVVAGLEKPGNVGAVIRSADGAGVAAVIVADPRTDLFNPNCIRASLGTVFTRPVCATTSAEALGWLRARGTKIYAARVDAELTYTEAELGGNVALVLGSEAAGLSPAWHAADVVPIKLPMRGTADSLNVSAAAAVLFYEALRQRLAARES